MGTACLPPAECIIVDDDLDNEPFTYEKYDLDDYDVLKLIQDKVLTLELGEKDLPFFTIERDGDYRWHIDPQCDGIIDIVTKFVPDHEECPPPTECIVENPSGRQEFYMYPKQVGECTFRIVERHFDSSFDVKTYTGPWELDLDVKVIDATN